MNKDFSKYQNIIDDFSGQVLNKDFEATFSVVAAHLPVNERFLLKMELKRLATPCSRLIDLRGHVSGECKQFEYDGKIHFLDDLAIKTFNKAIALYKSYTFGVYEAAMSTDNNFRVIYQKGKSLPESATKVGAVKTIEKTQYRASFHRFGPYHQRCEERMNFASPIQVRFDKKKLLECTSSDLSIYGCKLKIKGLAPIKIGQQLILRFLALEKVFPFESDGGFVYEIKNLTVSDDIQLVGVERVISEDAKPDILMKYLKSFIQDNKRRYKINLDNTLEALVSRSFEQYVLPKSNELPIFIENNNGSLLPRYVLTCNNNQGIYQYWQDEKSASVLSFLTSPKRIERLKKVAASGKQLLVFSFIHVREDKYYFYSADEIQLAEDEPFRRQFLGFAASKTNFAITQLSLTDVMLNRAKSPLSLPNALLQAQDNANDIDLKKVKSIFSKIPFIVVASDITRADIIETYKSFSYKNINVNKLKEYGHKRLNGSCDVKEVGIRYKNNRKEQRFKYKSTVHVNIEQVIQKGISHDFSVSGLKVELDKGIPLAQGDIVNISFPELQKISTNFNLKKLSYEVVGVNMSQSTVNLCASSDKHQHMGRQFFKALVEKNYDKLTPNEDPMTSSALVHACRNIYSSSSIVPSLIIQTSGSRYKIEALASGQNSNEITKLMSRLSHTEQDINLYPIVGRTAVLAKLTSNLKKMLRIDAIQTEILYIAIDHSVEEINKSVITKMVSELTSETEKHQFIHSALKNGDFFCLMIKISRTPAPDIEYLNPELSYVGANAIHRAKKIEQDIWSVAGIGQIFDITQEVIFNYQLKH